MLSFSTFPLDAFPGRTLSVALCVKVKNANEIRQRIIKEAPAYAVVNAQLVLDPIQLVVAAHSALQHERVKLRTRSLYTELIYALSPTNSIVDSISRFGVSDGAATLLLCVFDADEAKLESLSDIFNGEPMPLEALSTVANKNEILKAYKLKDSDVKDDMLLNAVLSLISTKDCM